MSLIFGMTHIFFTDRKGARANIAYELLKKTRTKRPLDTPKRMIERREREGEREREKGRRRDIEREGEIRERKRRREG